MPWGRQRCRVGPAYADYGQIGNPAGDPADEGGALRAQDVRTAVPARLQRRRLRVDPDGGTPAIVADGFRNPFRFAVRTGTSELWVGDVGARKWEELDRVAAPSPLRAVNFGWPCYEGAGRQSDYDALNKPLCENLYALGDTAWAKPYWTYSHANAVDQCPAGTAGGVGRRLRLHERRLPGRLPGRALRVGLHARLHLVPAARGATGCPTRRAWPRSPTAACTPPSSRPAPDWEPPLRRHQRRQRGADHV